MTTCQQRNGSGPHRRCAALAAILSSIVGAQPRPRDPPGQALIIQPRRLVPVEARRQDLGLPGPGRRLETFELTDQYLERIRPLHTGIWRNALPGEEKT